MPDAPALPAEPTARTLVKIALVAGLIWLAWKILSLLWRTSRIVLSVGLYIVGFVGFWAGIGFTFFEGRPEHLLVSAISLPLCWLAILIGGWWRGWLRGHQPRETARS